MGGIQDTIILAVMATGVAAPAVAVPVTLTATLLNPSPQAGDNFANDIAVGDGVAVVGAWLDDSHGTDAGAVYVYDTATGALIRELANPNLSDGDEFGSSVAIQGGRVLVGARSEDMGAENAGAAYLFDLATGALLRTYANPEPGSGDRFGRAVDIDGDRVLIGAYTDTPGPAPEQSRSGSAYLMEAATGAVVAVMRDATPRADGFYANEVALGSGVAAVGNYRDSDVLNQAGSAGLFDALTGALLHLVPNPDPEPVEFFGRAIAISGDEALISASWDNGQVQNGGTAYLVDLGTGAILREIPNPDPEEGDLFGHVVAMTENFLLIGARRDDAGAEDTGAAYLYNRHNGRLIQKILNPDPQPGDAFGMTLDMDGRVLVIGAMTDDTGAEDAGLAYVFTVAVPVPAALPLLIGGVGALGLLRRRRGLRPGS